MHRKQDEEDMKTNGYFKWILLVTPIFMLIISGSFAYTLVTNKRVDRLDDRIQQILKEQYKISAKLDYIINYNDGQNNDRDGDTFYFESPSTDSGDQCFGNTHTLIRTCYLLLFDQEHEKKDQE